MSSQRPAAEMEGTTPQTSSSAAAPPAKRPRVLACQLCQQRKVRCNRQFPCSGCVRQGVACVPAPLHPRRRRRRFPERELLDRLHRYEALLRQHSIPFVTLFEEVDGGGEAGVEGGGDTTTAPASEASHSPAGGGGTERDEHAAADARRRTRTTTDARSEADVSASMRRNFWNAVTLPRRSRRSAADGDSDGDGDDADADADDHDTSSASDEAVTVVHVVRSLWERHQDTTSSGLLLSSLHGGPGSNSSSSSSLAGLHPGPVHIFRLWQVYLDRVDPLFKVTHTPSLQPRIVEAAGNIGGVAAPLEALLFAVYCVAVQSMADDDCVAVFATPKPALLAAYHAACEHALVRCDVLRAPDRDGATALFLYLLSLGRRVDPRSVYAVLGAAARACHGLQLGREAPSGSSSSSSSRLPPLEAEMRRRLWWALALFDARIAELASCGGGPSALEPSWHCRVPLHASDLDFRPEMTEPPPPQARPAESLFVVVRCEIADALRHMDFFLALSNPALQPLAAPPGSGLAEPVSAAPTPTSTPAPAPAPAVRAEYAELNALEARLHERYLQYCDPNNSLHLMTLWTTQSFLARCRLIKYMSKYASAAAADPSSSDDPAAEALRDAALADALTVLTCGARVRTSPRTRAYRWFTDMYFPMPAYAHVQHELAQRLRGGAAAAAWDALGANYEAHVAPAAADYHIIVRAMAGKIHKTWEAFRARCLRGGGSDSSSSLPVPRVVVAVQSFLADVARKEREQKEQKEQQEQQQQQQQQQQPTTGDGLLDGYSMPDYSAGLFDIGPGPLTTAGAESPMLAGASPRPDLAAWGLGMDRTGPWPPLAWSLPRQPWM